MIPNSCLIIESEKFPILEGEDEELVNEKMYGKALCLYLEAELPNAGIAVPFFCNEDWGWWLEVEKSGFKMGLCIYSDPAAEGNPKRYAILPSIQEGRKWSWSKWKNVDHSADVLGLMSEVESVFKLDNDIRAVTRHNDYPF
jgi:hypothetical protein